MKKNSYLVKFEAAYEFATKATRTTMFKSGVAHMLGYAWELQYEATLDATLDGDDSECQNLSLKLAGTCLTLLNCESIRIDGIPFANFKEAYHKLKEFLESK